MASCCFKHTHSSVYGIPLPPQHFFFIHTYNEELQKTSQIKVPYFTLNMFFFFFLRLNKVAILAPRVVQTLPIATLRRPTAAQRLPRPAHSRGLGPDPTVPKNPLKEANSPPPPYHHRHRHRLAQQKRERKKRKKRKRKDKTTNPEENANPEAKL